MDIKLKPLDQQVIVITGASSGIGLATAEAAAHKAPRSCSRRAASETLDDIVGEINADGGQAIAMQCRRGRPRAGRTAGRRRRSSASAGSTPGSTTPACRIYGRLDEVDEADSRRLFDINFWGVVNGSLAALPHLRRSGGALINVGSEVSEAVHPAAGDVLGHQARGEGVHRRAAASRSRLTRRRSRSR